MKINILSIIFLVCPFIFSQKKDSTFAKNKTPSYFEIQKKVIPIIPSSLIKTNTLFYNYNDKHIFKKEFQNYFQNIKNRREYEDLYNTDGSKKWNISLNNKQSNPFLETIIKEIAKNNLMQ